jgi:hypothetical protein
MPKLSKGHLPNYAKAKRQHKARLAAAKKLDLSDVISKNPVTGRAPLKYWKDKAHRVKAIRALVGRLGLPVHELRINHFDDNGLLSMLIQYYKPPRCQSALKEAGFKMTDEVVYRKSAPYCTPAKRRRLAEALAKKLGKEVYELCTVEFKDASLGLLLMWSGGIRGLMRDCGYDPENIKRPHGRWSIRANRRKTIESLLKVTGKRPEELTGLDFFGHGAGRLLILYRKFPQDRRLNVILSDVGLSNEVIEPDEWGLPPRGLPGRWENVSRKERVRILRRIAEKLEMDLGDLETKHIGRLGLMGLVLNGPDAPRSFPKLLRWAGADPKRVTRRRRK